MWPYNGKGASMNKGGQIDYSNQNAYPVLTKNAIGQPDREYYKRLTMSVSVGLRSFPANRIASDGRIVRQYGINEHDVTDQFIVQNLSGKRGRPMHRQNQLHRRNVSQLKVVLNMPDRQRRDSLSHITGAIVRNEVVPPLSQLKNDEFLNEHLKKSTSNLQNKALKLPPLTRRVSIEQAKQLEQIASMAQSEDSNKYIVTDDASSELLDEDGLPVIKRRLSRRGSSEHFNMKGLGEHQSRNSNGFQRRRSVAYRHGFRRSALQGDNENASRANRKDSVGLLSESIREQFKSALQKQQMLPASDQQSVIPGPALCLSGCVGNESIVKKIPTETSKGITNGYTLRHEYGKNLERNWFKDQIMKKQLKHGNNNAGYDLRLSIFYSPEPKSDDELTDTDEGEECTDDEASMHCGGFSTATAEIKSRRMGLQSLRQSLDANEDIDEQSHSDSSNTDIEIILKDNKLIQRKTKHKMKKKRQRQMKRYRTFLPPEMNVVREQQETGENVPLTDQEIRALRLNLKNKERMSCLKGKRKFIQIINAVYAIVQFKNILHKVRQRRRQLLKKKQQKIAQMVAKRLAKKANEGYEESKRTPTPKPTLKEQFMKEFGEKLVFDVERLNIPLENNTYSHSGSDSDSDSDDDVATSTNDVSRRERKPEPNKQSKYELELKKVSLSDVNNMSPKFKKRKRRRYRKRRHSIPKAGCRPLEFTVEIPVKLKQRRSRSAQKKQREIRRPFSPPAPKCTCYRAKLAASTIQKCHHQSEEKKPKMKTIKVQTRGLMRKHSLPNISKMRPIELRDLLADIDIPAKEIKLQILARKFRRQRKRRQQIRLSPCRIPERPILQHEDSDNDREESEGSDDSDESDYDFVYGGPFVGSGVMWNQTSKDSNRRTWTDHDVDREVKRITRIFHEMKECTYLRLDGFNDAIMERLKIIK